MLNKVRITMEHCRRRENQLGQCYPGEKVWGVGKREYAAITGIAKMENIRTGEKKISGEEWV